MLHYYNYYIIDAFSMLVNFVFLDKKYAVYGRSFTQQNIVSYNSKYDNLYYGNFVNKDGDIWKVNQNLKEDKVL